MESSVSRLERIKVGWGDGIVLNANQYKPFKEFGYIVKIGNWSLVWWVIFIEANFLQERWNLGNFERIRETTLRHRKIGEGGDEDWEDGRTGFDKGSWNEILTGWGGEKFCNFCRSAWYKRWHWRASEWGVWLGIGEFSKMSLVCISA